MGPPLKLPGQSLFPARGHGDVVLDTGLRKDAMFSRRVDLMFNDGGQATS